mmetsp:Transcript_24910/g.69968  ORF Transcript_24910/g.69968 Transcript_24910/m.69968 type:complete len:214 (+) Transcript_24910:284-925(+)
MRETVPRHRRRTSRPKLRQRSSKRAASRSPRHCARLRRAMPWSSGRRPRPEQSVMRYQEAKVASKAASLADMIRRRTRRSTSRSRTCFEVSTISWSTAVRERRSNAWSSKMPWRIVKHHEMSTSWASACRFSCDQTSKDKPTKMFFLAIFLGSIASCSRNACSRPARAVITQGCHAAASVRLTRLPSSRSAVASKVRAKAPRQRQEVACASRT